MTAASPVLHQRPLAPMSASTVQRWARFAGLLFLVTMFAGFFGELYAPSRITVANDAAATARNIATMDGLFRLGFASYLVEAVCDVVLALVFYALLRPVHRELSLLAAFFGLVSTTLFAAGELFYFAPSLILGGADYLKVFTPAQLDAFALLSLKMYGRASGLFMVFYGVAMGLRGYLIYRSGFLPRALGAVVMLAGAGFIVKNFTLVLAPAYSSDFLLAPMFVAGLSLTLWLLFKGVDVARWSALARRHD